MQTERPGKEGGAVQHQGGAAGERDKAGTPHQRSERSAKSGVQREDKAGEALSEQHQTGKQSRPEGHGRTEERAQENRGQTRSERSAKTSPGARENERSEQNAERQGGRKAQGEHNAQGETRQRQSNVGSAARNEELGRESQRSGANRANIHISGAQKTQLHDAISHDTAIHRYHRGEVNFGVNIGTRIPTAIEFYDPPARFVEIDPEFRRFKIVVLDDEILVIDPVTREIVDVIPT
jgi:hypothetical protein